MLTFITCDWGGSGKERVKLTHELYDSNVCCAFLFNWPRAKRGSFRAQGLAGASMAVGAALKCGADEGLEQRLNCGANAV